MPSEHPERHQCDFEVKPERRMADVPLVKLLLFLFGDELGAIDLSPSGNSWTNRKPQRGVRGLILRQQRPRPNQRHIPEQHVDELRQFINPRRAQEATYRRRLSVTQSRPSRRIKGRTQGPVLVDQEWPPSPAGALLPEQNR